MTRLDQELWLCGVQASITMGGGGSSDSSSSSASSTTTNETTTEEDNRAAVSTTSAPGIAATSGAAVTATAGPGVAASNVTGGVTTTTNLTFIEALSPAALENEGASVVSGLINEPAMLLGQLLGENLQLGGTGASTAPAASTTSTAASSSGALVALAIGALVLFLAFKD
jgi:hypothetical protein